MNAIELVQAALNVQVPRLRKATAIRYGPLHANPAETLAAREKFGRLASALLPGPFEDSADGAMAVPGLQRPVQRDSAAALMART